ncbi:hypothetical protein BJX68DRAFT_270610 [Aspergillus pseudodeflectus]|uniref:AB hydrolase-1 domain-containing protein n=1 Tax=Aspergillus pseudodeflectus TaxID=176178 RepID=A0ABR4JQX2_9EURO
MSAQDPLDHSTDSYLPDPPWQDYASDDFILDTTWDPSHHRGTLHSRDGKRRLLLIYIHGFLGSEDSFYEFPRKVHDLLKAALSRTHVVYTKIYPRYKSQGPLGVARDDIIQWLSPHQAPDLDLILLGHSIGGLVAAEVALATTCNVTSHTISSSRLNHHFVGLVTFDAPFLGLHPRVVGTGISRLFSRKGDTNNEAEDVLQRDSIHNLSIEDDATFDSGSTSDIKKPRRTAWDGARHFIKKNAGQVSRSALQYVFSYYDHVGCLNNYFGLVRRHRKLCHWAKGGEAGRGLRFVNHYTSAGRLGEPLANDDRQNDKFHSDKQPLTCNETTQMYDRSNSRSRGRLFCYVPEKARGEKLWVPLYMDGMDEITAHQSMFLPLGTYYEQLVASTVARIESWIS